MYCYGSNATFLLQHDHVDVDARGPLGMTPLMVAAVRGGGLDTGSDAEDEQTAHIISELVAQGAQLNAAMDKTGETSLHLAARYVVYHIINCIK